MGEDVVIRRSVIAIFSARWQWAVLGTAILAPMVWRGLGVLVTLACVLVTAVHVIDVLNDALVLSLSGVRYASRGILLRRRDVFIPSGNIQAMEIRSGIGRFFGIGDIIIQHANGIEIFRFAIHPERAEKYARVVAANSTR